MTPILATFVNDLLTDFPWLKEEFGGNTLWQYILFTTYLLAAIALSKFANVCVSKWMTRLTDKTESKWDDRLVALLHGPLQLVVFLVFLYLGVAVLNKPNWLQNYLAKAFGIIAAAAITYVALKLVDLGHDILKAKFENRDKRVGVEILVLLRKATKVFVLLIAVLMTADNIGFKINSILAGLGIGGLAVALAAQETISNLIGSIVIVADRPFVIGDRVKIGADEGVVEYIGIRSTRLRSPDGDTITIPNKNIVAATVRNFSKK